MADKYVVTGGAGFIGSNLVRALNDQGFTNIMIVDSLGTGTKWQNLNGLVFEDMISKKEFYQHYLQDLKPLQNEYIFHLGACSDTREPNADYLLRNNHLFTVELAKYCNYRGYCLLLASSAATYGNLKEVLKDDEEELDELRPQTMYGLSKHLTDLWLYRHGHMGRTVSLKFTNVYGPGECHKGEMCSVARKIYYQAHEHSVIRLFKSYREGIADGEQKRDFIYIDDVIEILLHFLERPDLNGMYNVGSGRAESWNQVAKCAQDCLKTPAKVEYIEMPEHMRDSYQYHTKANIDKLRKEAGYEEEMITLREGIKQYYEYLGKKGSL